MELKQLESFVAVVVYKSFTEAAKQLYFSAYHQYPYSGS